MPLKRCSSDSKPGWKWGDSGKCYTYTKGSDASEKKAKRKALNQGIAMGDIDVTTSKVVEVTADGSVEIYHTPEPCVQIEGDSLVLNAGERLGAFLMRAREQKGRTRDWVISKMSNPVISIETYSSIEHGYLQSIPSDILAEIARVLGLDSKELKKIQKKDEKDPITYPNYY
jgi:hypothetical protein